MSLPTGSSRARSRPTIRDVAALAGVGIKTVSRVINDEANVSPQMRERVQNAVVALNFTPHQGAGSLRRGDHRTRTIGLLLEAVDNPFSAAINRAVEAVANDRDTAVFAASFNDDPELERDLVRAFTRRRVDGLILTTISTDHGYLQTEREQGTPIVFIDRPPVGLLADAVVTDNVAVARMATEHLLGHGHTRVVHLGDMTTISTARDRRAGYEAAMQARGLEPWPSVGDLHSVEAAERTVRRLLTQADPPSALFTSQNLVTVGALRALHGLGLQHRVALVGFDDLMLADLLNPGVTVLAQDPAEIGRLAALRLFARLDGSTARQETTVVPARLVPRGSGEIPAPPS